MANLVILAIAALFLAWLYQKAIYIHPSLLALPQPKRLPLVGHIFAFDLRNISVAAMNFFEKTNEKIMVLFLFNREVIFVSDPAISAQLIADDKNYERAGGVLDSLVRVIGSVLFVIDGPIWKERRMRLNHVFGAPKVRQLFPVIADKGRELVTYIEREMNQQGYVDVDAAFAKVTVDIIMSYICSTDSQALGNDPHGFSPFFRLLRDEATKALQFPFLLFVPTPGRIRFLLQRRKFESFILRLIRERKKHNALNPETEATDTLGILLDSGVSDSEIVAELGGLIFAGHDTTAHTMSFALYELARPENKRVLEKLMQEIDSVIPFSKLIASLAKIEDLSRLEYLSAVIKEVLRLYPIAATHIRHANKDVTVAGYHIPKGSSVLIHYYTMHRRAEYWPKPLELIPERWFDNDIQHGANATKVYMPFLNYSPHVCLGQHLALLELKVLLAALLKNFTFSMKPGCEMFVGQSLTLAPVPGLFMHAIRRK